MQFTVWDYATSSVIIPFCVIIAMLIIMTVTSRRIACRRPGSFTYLIPLLLWLVFTLGGLVTAGEGLKYPISVLLQTNAPLQVTTGQVTDIYNAPSPPIYYNQSSRSLQPAKMLVVDDTPYYILHTNAEKGAWVRLVWATEERVVYALETFTQEEVEAGLPELELPNQNSDKQESAKTAEIGTYIQCISMALCVCVIALQYPVGKRIAKVFQLKDACTTGKVVPNRYGLLYYAVTTWPIFGILVGFWLTGFRGVWVIALIGATAFFVILFKKQTTTLELQQDVLIYKTHSSVKRISVKDISFVQWDRSSIPYNRRLIIKLTTGGSIDLEQEHYLGLEDMYRELKTALEPADNE